MKMKMKMKEIGVYGPVGLKRPVYRLEGEDNNKTIFTRGPDIEKVYEENGKVCFAELKSGLWKFSGEEN